MTIQRPTPRTARSAREPGSPKAARQLNACRLIFNRHLVAAFVGGAAMSFGHAQTPPAAASATAPAASSAPVSAAKKALVDRVLQLQQPLIENLARTLVERPAAQMMQEAGRVLQTQVPPDRRETAGKAVEADVKLYVDEAVPLVRDRAVKLAPSTIGTALEQNFSEDELKALIAWFDSPVNKKFQQLGADMQNAFVQKLVPDVRPLVDPKLQALEQKVRTTLTAAVGSPASSAQAPASAASSKAAAPKPAAPKAPAAK